MTEQEETKISSNWTTVSLYASVLIILVFVPMMIFTNKDRPFHMGMPIAILAISVLICLTVYQFIFVCTAKIVGDTLVLKKQFRPEKTYSFDKIGQPKSLQLGSNRYITFRMTNDDNTLEKYIILNSSSMLAFESRNAEQVLLGLRIKAQRKAWGRGEMMDDGRFPSVSRGMIFYCLFLIYYCRSGINNKKSKIKN